jgi:hypothetical protein
MVPAPRVWSKRVIPDMISASSFFGYHNHGMGQVGHEWIHVFMDIFCFFEWFSLLL